MSAWLCFLNGVLWSWLFSMILNTAHAHELKIINVQNNIKLSDTDPHYRDYYLSGEGIQNLKKNGVVTAVRKINLRDASGSQAYGEIKIPVGQLKVIQIYNNIAIAREHKLLSREDLPVLEQIGFLVGDFIETKSSYLEKK